MRAPVAPKGWPRASEPPWTLSFAGSTSPDRLVATEAGARERRAREHLEDAEDLRGEGLVHVDEVDVGEPSPARSSAAASTARAP